MSSSDPPRPEYPRPQFERRPWTNCNGEWAFETDPGRSGRARGLPTADSLDGTITVPFPPESERSGVGDTDFTPAVWYRRTVDLPASYFDGRVRLHVGAADYEAEVWVNGESVGTHRGGYTPFAFDVTDAATPGTNVVTVCVEDDTRDPRQPSGKQAPTYESRGAHYTRVTGIWQTVWVEPVPETYLADVDVRTDPASGTVTVLASVGGSHPTGGTLAATLSLDGADVGRAEATLEGDTATLTVDLEETRRWTPADPTLYDCSLVLDPDGAGVDAVESYVGLRTVSVGDDGELRLNGDPHFQRLVLDQGYHPEGVYTAPSDERLRRDVERAKAMGFDGARLHEKLFDPRFLYWSDRLGYLVWGEFGDWGLDKNDPAALGRFLPEWEAALERDRNHPSVVGWCPFNETARPFDEDAVRTIYRTTKRLDPTRPVVDSSGWHHVETDVVDAHDYDQDPASFRERYERVRDGETVTFEPALVEDEYGPETTFVSEYGGTLWDVGDDDVEAWGHGDVDSEAAFLDRVEGLTAALLENPTISGFCYTQLYDIEQERNGLYTYDREPKFDPERLAAVFGAPAAVEE
jgi:beta-galactosidase/beta-glucuronidase